MGIEGILAKIEKQIDEKSDSIAEDCSLVFQTLAKNSIIHFMNAEFADSDYSFFLAQTYLNKYDEFTYVPFLDSNQLNEAMIEDSFKLEDETNFKMLPDQSKLKPLLSGLHNAYKRDFESAVKDLVQCVNEDNLRNTNYSIYLNNLVASLIQSSDNNAQFKEQYLDSLYILCDLDKVNPVPHFTYGTVRYSDFKEKIEQNLMTDQDDVDFDREVGSYLETAYNLDPLNPEFFVTYFSYSEIAGSNSEDIMNTYIENFILDINEGRKRLFGANEYVQKLCVIAQDYMHSYMQANNSDFVKFGYFLKEARRSKTIRNILSDDIWSLYIAMSKQMYEQSTHENDPLALDEKIIVH